MIIIVIVAIISAFITWKLFPLSLSRKDLYRSSPIEILKQRGIKTFAVFVVICFFGYGAIIGTMRKNKSKENKSESEEVSSKEPKRKKHKHNETKNISYTDTIANDLTEKNVVETEQISSEEKTDHTETETTIHLDSL